MSKTIDYFANSYHLPIKPAELSNKEKYSLYRRIIRMLKDRDAVIIAHYYTDPEIQRLAEATGGCVADSLEMARFGKNHSATTLLVAGVRFMGETAKILSPEKTVLMPTLKAECSLDLGCPEKAFSAFCKKHPNRTIVVYANTSAAVKAHADWVVTASIAVKLIDYLDSIGEKIIWAPDRHLGHYVQQQTGADMICWQGSCVVHDEFKAQALLRMKKIYPKAAVLVHPESPQAVIELADVVGSTSQLIQAARVLTQQQIIVATDLGIFFKMQQACPEKNLLVAPTTGEGATCRSCAHCPWMAMNGLQAIASSLEKGGAEHEVQIAENVLRKALIPLNSMLSFANNLDQRSHIV